MANGKKIQTYSVHNKSEYVSLQSAPFWFYNV